MTHAASKTDTEEKKLLNKVFTFVFLYAQKYSRSFHNITFEPLMSHELQYFNNVFTTFLDLKCGSSLAVYAGSEISWISLKNILICVLKMNESLMGWHE